MPTPPKATRHEIKVSHNAFEEVTSALNEAGIKLEKSDEILIKPDMALTGPILYRQVNLRHQIIMEVVKIYKAPINAQEMEYNDSKDFIQFVDDVYKYVLTGDKPTTEKKSEPLEGKSNKQTGWN